MEQPRIEQHGDDVHLWVKAVPGASRDEVAGVLGDRLKVRVGAAAEGGKANDAICRVLGRMLGLKAGRVQVEGGATSRDKVVRILDARSEDVRAVVRSIG